MTAFWLHYNKPMSLRLGKPQVTVHHNNVCYVIDNVDIQVPVHGRLRKQQPYFVLAGKASNFKITNNIMVIT